MNTKLLKPEEAAELLNISRSKLYGCLAKGELRSLKIGRSRRIPMEAIDAFICVKVAASLGTVQA